MPGVEAVRKDYEGRGVAFVALSLHPEVDDVVRVARQHGVGMTLAVAQDEVLGPLGVRVIPSTVFVDARGVVVAVAEGERSERFFRRRLDAMLP